MIADDEVVCSLDSSVIESIYSQDTKMWILNDEALNEVGDDIQSVVECSNSGDTIVFQTKRKITPLRTIEITQPLYFNTINQTPNEEVDLSDPTVTLLRLPDAPLLIIK